MTFIYPEMKQLITFFLPAGCWQWPKRLSILWLMLLLPTTQPVSASSALQPIMQAMEASTVQIGEGIWREDYLAISEAATAIAGHPMPGLLDRLALLSRIGGDASRFMQADEAVQEAALDIKRAAERQSLAEVAEHYWRMQQHCLNCHLEFRAKFTAPAQPAAWDEQL